ncbi:MAG: BREX-1 system adenine-specific DNA-methyltransferase PglX [Thiotrichaceae bacterium]|nr:BREX-1 system adenine-specific DNA-methyltransferase PglX [Thiotrichaceae bacterium]
MDTAKIKSYAPKARKSFIEAIARQAALLAITEQGISPIEIKGDVALIDGKPYPAAIAQQRRGLETLIEQHGYQQVIEKIAYSWFNRLVALRYMELHNYLDHGRRVLSHPEQENAYQILEECADIEMDGLDKQQVIQLKLAGDKDEALYRLLLLAQCHQLHQAMGFLFEAVDDASELLLPNNLTKTDSLIRQLVSAIPEEQWQNVEIIGWLYQFYISEKKDQVIGKVVKSEDIPAATQLFTPNWIVKYLVQNSIGRQWLMTYPDSPLKGQMEYYIEPAEQTAEVQAQLNAITPASIDPQTIKVLDPACGSGHILVEAYDLLKAIYAERGYRSRDIPQLILENNLYGLDIDDCAAQLAGFALLMKARADDRRIFTRNINFNVLALQSSEHLNPLKLWSDLNLRGQWQKEQTDDLFGSAQGEFSEPQNDANYQLIVDLVERFQQAKTFGSLIDVPHEKQAAIKLLYQKLLELSEQGDTREKPAALILLPIIHQALLLSQRYDAVVANPPYMGGKGMNADLKAFAKKRYPNSKSDLFAIFMEHAFSLLNENGHNAQVNMQSWMFLSSYEKLREWLLDTKTFVTMAHLGARAFGQISGEVVQTTAWILNKKHVDHFQPVFFRLIEGNEGEKKQVLLSKLKRFDQTRQDDLKKIPGSPVAYWLTDKTRSVFSVSKSISEYSPGSVGLQTGDNDKFIRRWFEVNFQKMVLNCSDRGEVKRFSGKWFPYNKGGEFRKWYGNQEYVVNWENDGEGISSFIPRAVIRNPKCYFKPSMSWSDVTSGLPAFRYFPSGFIYDVTGMSAHNLDEERLFRTLAFCNTKIVSWIVKSLNPTLHFQVGNYSSLPCIENAFKQVDVTKVSACVSLTKHDWNSYETSWGFESNPLVKLGRDFKLENLAAIFNDWLDGNRKSINELKQLEVENNQLFLDAYSLQSELTPDVSLDQVSLTVNSAFRYAGETDETKLSNRFQSDSLYELISYAIGCMLGRYSLDREGLIYAHAANEGFAELVAEGAYKTFPADDDGIIPLSDQEWFDDDATNRFRDFVKTVWGEEQLQENLAFVAESLCLHVIKAKSGETSLETIRRYLATQFYKNHLKTYKKRPIYWLFSSGKQKAFECLVYLHRYNAGTLARMRTEYVIPLTSKLNSHVEKLEQDKESTESAAEVKKIEKELQILHKKQAELSSFDEKLRHCADQRIELDLDDGVKVNYGRFGDLLADVKAVMGKKK